MPHLPEPGLAANDAYRPPARGEQPRGKSEPTTGGAMAAALPSCKPALTRAMA